MRSRNAEQGTTNPIAPNLCKLKKRPSTGLTLFMSFPEGALDKRLPAIWSEHRELSTPHSQGRFEGLVSTHLFHEKQLLSTTSLSHSSKAKLLAIPSLCDCLRLSRTVRGLEGAPRAVLVPLPRHGDQL